MRKLSSVLLVFTLVVLVASCANRKKMRKKEAAKEAMTEVAAEQSCIDESLIDPNRGCTKEYAPVCGCNDETYGNECYASKAGVTSWTEGECASADKETAYPIAACVDHSAVKDNSDCPKVEESVCGCDGQTYTNACHAERAGVQRFTPGTCEGSCIDPSKISLKACTKQYDPVCGCNDVTYGNKCMAQAAGLTSWKGGRCKE